MNVTKILQFADELVFTEKQRHLNDIEKAVIMGVYEGKSYKEISEKCNRSESRVRNVGHEIWKILSEQLGEDINKDNFCWTFEKSSLQSSQIKNIHTVQNSHHFSFYSGYEPDINSSHKSNINQQQSSHYDLTIAPKITHFYGRETELQTLSHWLINQNTRLISVLGLPGIGKTTLVKKFIDLNLQNFNIIIWKNIKLSDSLDSIISEIFKFINSELIQTENKLTQLFNLFRQQKCLIILDNIQELFTAGQLAGQYKHEYKDYKTFLTMMTEIEHQSNLILISQEQCQEMICIDEELYPIKCLELQGLDNTDILKNQKLKDEENWLNLIKLYEGNPAYLQDVASLIKNIFQGKTSEFINEESLLLTEDIKSQLNELFNRLSSIEKQIVLEMSKISQPISREDLREALPLSSTDLINGLQSLNRRYLVTLREGKRTLFNLSPVFREYIR